MRMSRGGTPATQNHVTTCFEPWNRTGFAASPIDTGFLLSFPFSFSVSFSLFFSFPLSFSFFFFFLRFFNFNLSCSYLCFHVRFCFDFLCGLRYMCVFFFQFCCRVFLTFHLISYLIYTYVRNIFRFWFCFDSFSMLNDKYMMAKCKKGTSLNMIILTAHEGNTIDKWEWHFHRRMKKWKW